MVRFGRQVSINSHSVNHTQQILQIHEISESLRSVITVIRCIACKFVKVLDGCLFTKFLKFNINTEPQLHF